MKRAIILSVMAMFLMAMPAFAMDSGESKDKEKTFEQRKEGVIKMLDKRISVLQEHKGCVTNAKTKDDLMSCRKKFEEEREQMRERMKDRKKEHEK